MLPSYMIMQCNCSDCKEDLSLDHLVSTVIVKRKYLGI